MALDIALVLLGLVAVLVGLIGLVLPLGWWSLILGLGGAVVFFVAMIVLTSRKPLP